MQHAISGARPAAPRTSMSQAKPVRQVSNFDQVPCSSKTFHQIFSLCKTQKPQILFPAWLQWQICSYQLWLMYSQLEDFLLPGFLELGGEWVLTMSTSPPTWSGNIPEGIAPKKNREREKHIEIHPPRTFPAPRCLRLWDSQLQKDHPGLSWTKGMAHPQASLAKAGGGKCLLGIA